MQEKIKFPLVQVVNYYSSLNISCPDKLMLTVLASFSGVRGICPGINTIAQKMGISTRQVYRSLKRLEDQKLIIIIRSAGRKNQFELPFLSTASDTDDTGTPDTYVSPTPDIHVTKPLTSLTQTPDMDVTHRIIQLNNREREQRCAKSAHPLSGDFIVSKASLQKAKELGLSEEEANDELDKFMNYYMGKGVLNKDWNLLLQNWFIRAQKYKTTNVTGMANKYTKSEVRSTVPWFTG